MVGLVIDPTFNGPMEKRPGRRGASSIVHSVRTLREPFSMAT